MTAYAALALVLAVSVWVNSLPVDIDGCVGGES